MPSSNSRFLRAFLCCLAIVVGLSLAGSSLGQDGDQLGTEKDVKENYERKDKSQLHKLLKGTEPYDAKNPKHTSALDGAAKYVAYRLTWGTVQQNAGEIEKIFDVDLTADLKSIALNKTNHPEMAQAYTKAMIVRANEVLSNRKPIARINAARVLAKLAELGQGELADALVDSFTQEEARDWKSMPKRNDGVKYHLLHGMRDLLALPVPAAPAPPVLTPERERKLAETILAFVNKPETFAKDTPADEKAGYHVLRREAIRALAFCRAPGLKDKARPAMTLLRIVARDGLTPEPRLDERYEAALGVARLRPASDGKEYQPEYAMHQLAQFVDVFGRYYTDHKDSEQRPFRIYAGKLIDVLEAMKSDLKNPYVNEGVDKCLAVLLQAEKGEPVANTVGLRQWIDAKMPPTNSLFQGVADSTVKPANRMD